MHREAYTWFDNEPTVVKTHEHGELIRYLVAKDSIVETDLVTFKKKKYDTFDEYKNNFDKVISIKFHKCKEQWMTESSCTCRTFQKMFICKHLLGLAFYHKLKRCPEEGSNKEISKKPKRGRVAFAKSALQKQ